MKSNLSINASVAAQLRRESNNPRLSPEARAALCNESRRITLAVAESVIGKPPAACRSPLLVDLARAARTSVAAGTALTHEQRQAQEALQDEWRACGISGSGIVYPWAESRALTATGETAVEGDQGGMTVGTAVPSIGLALRDALVLARLGATVLTGLRENLHLPRENAGIAPEWAAEAAAPSPAAPLLGELVLSAKRVTAYFDATDQLLIQGAAVEPFIRAALAAALAEAVQQAVINGTGANHQPLGILTTPALGSVADAGGQGSAPTYADLCDLEYIVTNAKADRGQLGYITSPKVRKALRKIFVNGTGSLPLWPIDDPYSLWGFPAGVTTSCPDTLSAGANSGNLSGIIFGEWSELFVGIWGPGVLVDAVPVVSGSDGMKGLVRFVASIYIDSGVRRPEAFAIKPDCIIA